MLYKGHIRTDRGISPRGTINLNIKNINYLWLFEEQFKTFNKRFKKIQ